MNGMSGGTNRKWVGQQTSISQEIKRNLRNYSDAQVLAEVKLAQSEHFPAL